MANEKNLIPMSERTESELREMTKKGGVNSGKSRRERKTFRETLLTLLQEPGVQDQINIAMLQKAMNGDTKAYELIRDTIGEKPVDRSEVDIGDKTINVVIDDKS